jgi:hypothetical protein
MSRAAVSILAFGVYLASAGVLLIFVPRQMCRILSIAQPEGAWIRIIGMLFLFLAFYCWRAAREENASFIHWTLFTRPTTLLFLAWFVASGWLEPIVLVFGVIDLVATGWTFVAIRADARAAANGVPPASVVPGRT